LDEAFDVVIHREQPVSHLKRLIKDQNQHTFAHLDAKRLSLWGVSIPVWNKREFENLVLENSKKLQPLRKIGDMFKDELFEDCIDIIVRIPGKRDPFRFLTRIFEFPPALLDSGRVVKRTEETDELYEKKLSKPDPPNYGENISSVRK
jgi:hypothetical protein